MRTVSKSKASNAYTYDWKRIPASRSGPDGPLVPVEFERVNKDLVWVPQRIMPPWTLGEFLMVFEACYEETEKQREARLSFEYLARSQKVGRFRLRRCCVLFFSVSRFTMKTT